MKKYKNPDSFLIELNFGNIEILVRDYSEALVMRCEATNSFYITNAEYRMQYGKLDV